MANQSKPRAAASPTVQRSGSASKRSKSKSREEKIAEAAYYRASQRGFQPGGEIEDWLAAEAEVDKPRGSGGRRKASVG